MTNQDTPAAGREDDAMTYADWLRAAAGWCSNPGTLDQGISKIQEIADELDAERARAPAPQPDAPEPVVWQYRMRMYGERYAWKDTTKEHAHLIDGPIWEIRRKPDDIVARLRSYRVLADRGGITSEVPDPLMIEAADEIERLTRSGAGEVTEAMIQAGRRAWNECYSTDCNIVVRDILRAALAAAPPRAGATETPQQLLQKADALLHDVDGDHADWAHAFLHQAAAHLSDSERGQRVSDADLYRWFKPALRRKLVDGQWFDALDNAMFDLRDACATIAELRAENERLRAEVCDTLAIADAQDMAITNLTAALAIARRDGWIEGRDAAANEAASIPNMLLHTSPDHVRGLRGSDVAERIRALTPPAAADGGRDDDAFDARGREIERLTKERDEAIRHDALESMGLLQDLAARATRAESALAEARRMVETLAEDHEAVERVFVELREAWIGHRKHQDEGSFAADLCRWMNIVSGVSLKLRCAARALADVKGGARDE